MINNNISFLIPQDFYYLKRGGRINKTAASLGGLLKLNIVLIQSEDGKSLSNGNVEKIEMTVGSTTLKVKIKEIILID